MKEVGYRVTPINPFTPRQVELVTLLANGHKVKEAASHMGIAKNTAKNLICGYGENTPGQRGVLGTLEAITGTRPPSHRKWLEMLKNDVLLPVDLRNNNVLQGL